MQNMIIYRRKIHNKKNRAHHKNDKVVKVSVMILYWL